MDNLEILLATTVNKASEKSIESIVKRSIKPRASKIFRHPGCSLDGPGPSVAVSGPHEELCNSNFSIWIGGNKFRWMLHINHDSRGMGRSMTKADYSGTGLKLVARGSYEAVNIGAWETWHISPHTSTKGGGVPVLAIYQKARGLHQACYNGV